MFASREFRVGKTVPEVLSTALKTEGTVFSNTDQLRLVNNIFIFSNKPHEILSKRTQ